MDQKTLEALDGSIEKWRKIVEEGGEDGGHWDCPLCELFWCDTTSAMECRGCPVSEKTGQKNCHGTPYVEWCKACKFEPEEERSPQAKAAARAELEFLRSLRPKEEAS